MLPEVLEPITKHESKRISAWIRRMLLREQREKLPKRITEGPNITNQTGNIGTHTNPP